jgi:hypothetical protein
VKEACFVWNRYFEPHPVLLCVLQGGSFVYEDDMFSDIFF